MEGIAFLLGRRTKSENLIRENYYLIKFDEWRKAMNEWNKM